MGITAHIYKHPLFAKCSNRGISETFDQVTIVNARGPFEPTATAPAVLIESHGPGILRAVPAAIRDDNTWAPAPGWWMAGGAFVATSDGRVADLCRHILTASVAKSYAEAGASKRHREGDRAFYQRLAEHIALVGQPFYGAIALHDRKE